MLLGTIEICCTLPFNSGNGFSKLPEGFFFEMLFVALSISFSTLDFEILGQFFFQIGFFRKSLTYLKVPKYNSDNNFSDPPVKSQSKPEGEKNSKVLNAVHCQF